MPQMRQGPDNKEGQIRQVHCLLQLPHMQIHQTIYNRRQMPPVRGRGDSGEADIKGAALLGMFQLSQMQIRHMEQTGSQGMPLMRQSLYGTEGLKSPMPQMQTQGNPVE